MRIFDIKLSAFAIVSVGVMLGGCGKQAPTATNGAPTHDAAYYASHPDEAKARDIDCNKSQAAGDSLSAEQSVDCGAARKAAHEADNPVYVPGNGKVFSSAGGTK